MRDLHDVFPLVVPRAEDIPMQKLPANGPRQINSHRVAGLEWCIDLAGEIDQRLGEIPLLEFIPENFMTVFGFTKPKALFDRIERLGIPVLVHSVGLSLASVEPFKQKYFENMLEVMRALPTTVSLSDHLCLTEKDGNEIGQLTTTPYNVETLDAVTHKIETIQKQISVPFAIENITHCFQIPDQEIAETEFINRVIDRTGAKLLLDLNNIHTNGVNFGTDPWAWLAGIDLADVDAIHLAGGFVDEDDGMLMDGHCASVPEPVWKLYDHVIRHAGRPITTIVEWTANNKPNGLQPVLDDQNRAQAILDKYYPVTPALRIPAAIDSRSAEVRA